MKMINKMIKNYEMIENWFNCIDNAFFMGILYFLFYLKTK